MKRIILVILALQVILVVSKPADDEVGADAVAKGAAETAAAVGPTTTLAPSQFAPQCQYNFKGSRLNDNCKSELPPKCEKEAAVLVKTTVGDDYEMCCCNV
jgi:hypothetical protein